MDDEELFRSIQDKKKRRGVDLTHAFSRREEAHALLKLIRPDDFKLSGEDMTFLDSIEFQMKNENYEPTLRQVFWLRDCRDRIL
jgi:hypothetical protein